MVQTSLAMNGDIIAVVSLNSPPQRPCRLEVNVSACVELGGRDRWKQRLLRTASLFQSVLGKQPEVEDSFPAVSKEEEEPSSAPPQELSQNSSHWWGSTPSILRMSWGSCEERVRRQDRVLFRVNEPNLNQLLFQCRHEEQRQGTISKGDPYLWVTSPWQLITDHQPDHHRDRAIQS